MIPVATTSARACSVCPREHDRDRRTCDLHPFYGAVEKLDAVSGRLRLRLAEQDLVLTRGEAAEFDTRTPHAMTAAGSKPAFG